MFDIVSKQTKKPRKGLFYVKQKDILVWERTLLIDNIYDPDTRNHDDDLGIHSDNGHDAYCGRDNVFYDGVYFLNSIFSVGGSGVCYSCNEVHGVARYNHGDDDPHSRLDIQVQYLFLHLPGPDLPKSPL